MQLNGWCLERNRPCQHIIHQHPKAGARRRVAVEGALQDFHVWACIC
jgi:hypothetical protein